MHSWCHVNTKRRRLFTALCTGPKRQEGKTFVPVGAFAFCVLLAKTGARSICRLLTFCISLRSNAVRFWKEMLCSFWCRKTQKWTQNGANRTDPSRSRQIWAVFDLTSRRNQNQKILIVYWLASCQNQSGDRIFWFWSTNRTWPWTPFFCEQFRQDDVKSGQSQANDAVEYLFVLTQWDSGWSDSASSEVEGARGATSGCGRADPWFGPRGHNSLSGRLAKTKQPWRTNLAPYIQRNGGVNLCFCRGWGHSSRTLPGTTPAQTPPVWIKWVWHVDFDLCSLWSVSGILSMQNSTWLFYPRWPSASFLYLGSIGCWGMLPGCTTLL